MSGSTHNINQLLGDNGEYLGVAVESMEVDEIEQILEAAAALPDNDELVQDDFPRRRFMKNRILM
jgi:hypothetical protein